MKCCVCNKNNASISDWSALIESRLEYCNHCYYLQAEPYDLLITILKDMGQEWKVLISPDLEEIVDGTLEASKKSGEDLDRDIQAALDEEHELWLVEECLHNFDSVWD
ncbi:hypothetical protein M5X17_27730 [Paenibacillus alvei]|uniref:hypothetical protein n=1 Tax=Paenibacillus alvei TaxID=44250 RepID=UPI00227F4A53|nr:hypothetical protein [Paenibacillus alvei]MCY9737497.1 hypothetical protein [Paenibacillus alvei]